MASEASVMIAALMDYKVPMREIDVQVALADSEPSDYVIFLSAYAQHHLGFETLGEYLNGRRSFFPMVIGGQSKIINRDTILWVLTRSVLEEANEADVAIRKETFFELVDHSTFEGRVVIDRPAEQSRISDLLNDPKEHFIRLDVDSGSYFINKRFIRAAIPR